MNWSFDAVLQSVQTLFIGGRIAPIHFISLHLDNSAIWLQAPLVTSEQLHHTDLELSCGKETNVVTANFGMKGQRTLTDFPLLSPLWLTVCVIVGDHKPDAWFKLGGMSERQVVRWLRKNRILMNRIEVMIEWHFQTKGGKQSNQSFKTVRQVSLLSATGWLLSHCSRGGRGPGMQCSHPRYFLTTDSTLCDIQNVLVFSFSCSPCNWVSHSGFLKDENVNNNLCGFFCRTKLALQGRTGIQLNPTYFCKIRKLMAELQVLFEAF